jgi:hypothetical protein
VKVVDREVKKKVPQNVNLLHGQPSPGASRGWGQGSDDPDQ